MTEDTTSLVEHAEPLDDDERAAIPVFPLPRVVLFPRSVLPLHLFEPRYRALMESCLEKGPMAIAVAQLAPGWEDDYEGRPPIHSIAGVGRIMDHHRRADGRFDLVLHGVGRYRLEELPQSDEPFRRARASFLPDAIPHADAVERLVPALLATAATVTALVRQRYPEFELAIDAESPPGFVADRIADRLVRDVDKRQAILEAVDVKRRLALAQEEMVSLLAQLRHHGGTN